MRLLFMCLILSLRLMAMAVEVTNDSEDLWKFDNDMLYNDVPCLRTPVISDNDFTSVTLTFTDVSSVEFYVKSSSESGCDKLTVDFGDGNTYECSGVNDYWESVRWDWGGNGEHIVTLTYSKDVSVSSGEDCCWIWFEGVDTLNLGDDSSKDWDMSKEHAWECYPWMTYQNSAGKAVPFMKTPYLEDGQDAWISYAVEGREAISFQYSISSEENSDRLIVMVDGNEVASFSGDCWGEGYEVQLPNTERHIIKWIYRKDENGNSAGNDEAYVWFEGIENIMLEGYTMNLVYPWMKDSEVTYAGESLRSSAIPDNEMTSFSVIVPNGREDFGYTWKVSSEEGCDFLRVYKNDELMNSISGEVDWESSWFWANPGDVIRFEYAKDDNGKSAGQDCGWVWFDGIEKFMSVMHLFPDDDTVIVEASQTIVLDLNTGRDVQRGILDGDEGVSFASGEYSAWVHDENEGAMRSAEVVKGGESWMSATVVGKGTVSFRWKSSGETLSCYVDGELKETLCGAADWTQVDVALEDDARHEIKWVFKRGEDSSDVAAAGWVDGIVWNAPEGWDDPDEPIVPDTVSSFIKLDLRPSPRILEDKDVVEEIVYDPAWVNGAASAVLSIGGIEKISSAESGTHEWTPGDAGEFEMKLVFKNASGNQIGEPLTALFKVVLDPLPQLGGNATAAEVAAIINGAADAKLKERVVDYVTYTNFCAWVNGKGVDHRAAMDSLYSWISYALDTAGLILVPPKEGDLKIDGFTPVNDGVIELEVNLKDISVGENATAANLEKVFGVEGAEKLMSDGLGELGVGFSSDNVEVNAAAPQDGNVKFTVTPKTGNGEKPESFFFRVKMKQ